MFEVGFNSFLFVIFVSQKLVPLIDPLSVRTSSLIKLMFVSYFPRSWQFRKLLELLHCANVG